MSNIVLSSAIRSNLLSLQGTADLLAQTQTRLATGKRVNSALDNPTNFFSAANLNARASDLTNLLDSISNATRNLEAADHGIKAITSLVESAQASARQAIQSTGTTAKYSGTTAGLSSTSSFTVANANTITVNDGTTTATIASTGSLTVQQFLDGINNTANLKVKASLTGDGRVQLEATGTNTIVLAGTATAAEKAQFGLVDGTTAAGTLNSSRTSYAAQYNEVRTQIDKLAADASFNGINLLNGDALTIVFNEKGTSKFTISGVRFDAANLGIATSGNNFQTDYDINAGLTQLSTALQTLRTQASTLGSNLSVVQTRQDFTKAIVNVLKTGADNLTLADTNEEGANLLALQTRQQLSTTALSLSAQAAQAVLRLFG